MHLSGIYNVFHRRNILRRLHVRKVMFIVARRLYIKFSLWNSYGFPRFGRNLSNTLKMEIEVKHQVHFLPGFKGYFSLIYWMHWEVG